jgi:drug/metabolite transporter (DMT)-like permease
VSLNLSQNYKAMLWMMLTGFLSVSIYTLARKLGGYFHPTQTVFFYNLLGACCYLPMIATKRLSLPTTRIKLFGLRALLEFSAFSLSFAAITQMPFPVHATLEFTSPLFGSLLAVILLGERNHMHRWVALACGFMGVLVVTRPWTAEFPVASFYVLAAAILFAGCGMCIKKLTSTEPAARIAFYMLSLTALCASPFAIYHWKMPLPEHIPLLVLFGSLVAAVQFTVARAFASAPVTLILPFFFLNLLWASLYAFFLFDEMVSPYTILGAVFIIGGAAYAAYYARDCDKEIMKASEQASLGS